MSEVIFVPLYPEVSTLFCCKKAVLFNHDLYLEIKEALDKKEVGADKYGHILYDVGTGVWRDHDLNSKLQNAKHDLWKYCDRNIPLDENMLLSRKANLGCGPLPLYPQDIQYMGDDWRSWLLIDKYIKQPGITNWDIETLENIPDNYLEEIFTAHALEHISHRKVIDVLKLWYKKLAKDGNITIIVPDLMYALKQLKAIDNDQVPEGYYDEIFGLKSPLSIIYGTHSQEGEYHLGGFTGQLLATALDQAGFNNIKINTQYEDHQMDCLIAKGTK